MPRAVLLSSYLLVVSACATSFTGSAQVEGGRPGCERKCAAVGLEMQSFVFMGEYSTACVCERPGRAAHAGVASSPVAAAVLLHMRAAQTDFCAPDDCARFSN